MPEYYEGMHHPEYPEGPDWSTCSCGWTGYLSGTGMKLADHIREVSAYGMQGSAEPELPGCFFDFVPAGLVAVVPVGV